MVYGKDSKLGPILRAHGFDLRTNLRCGPLPFLKASELGAPVLHVIYKGVILVRND